MTRPGVLLTERDLAVLSSLRMFRFLTCAQVQRLHAFPSESTVLRRLRRLEHAGLLRRARTPVFGAGLLTLTARGLELTVDGHVQTGGRVRVPKLPGPLFLRHLAAVNDFRIALLESLRDRPDVRLLRFLTDSDRAWAGPGRSPQSPLGATIEIPGEALMRHAPDAAFVLERQGRRALFFVEVDCGTEVIGQGRRGVGRLVRFYLHALGQGRAAALIPALALDEPPPTVRVLLVTTSGQRVANIRRVWGGRRFEREAAKRLIWLTDFAQLDGAELLNLRWRSLDPADQDGHRMAGGDT